jgi:hypothetical protein
VDLLRVESFVKRVSAHELQPELTNAGSLAFHSLPHPPPVDPSYNMDLSNSRALGLEMTNILYKQMIIKK